MTTGRPTRSSNGLSKTVRSHLPKLCTKWLNTKTNRLTTCRNVVWGWSWIWRGLFIYSAEGSNRILRNVCTIPAEFTASHAHAIHLYSCPPENIQSHNRINISTQSHNLFTISNLSHKRINISVLSHNRFNVIN